MILYDLILIRIPIIIVTRVCILLFKVIGVAMSLPVNQQHTIIVVKTPHKEPTVLAKMVGSLMGTATTISCIGVFVARYYFDDNCTGAGDAALWAAGVGVIMSVATLILQKSADIVVDATIFMIKLPFNIIAYPFTSGSSKADQLASEIINSSN